MDQTHLIQDVSTDVELMTGQVQELWQRFTEYLPKHEKLARSFEDAQRMVVGLENRCDRAKAILDRLDAVVGAAECVIVDVDAKRIANMRKLLKDAEKNAAKLKANAAQIGKQKYDVQAVLDKYERKIALTLGACKNELTACRAVLTATQSFVGAVLPRIADTRGPKATLRRLADDE